jgi:hypothetical protein
MSSHRRPALTALAAALISLWSSAPAHAASTATAKSKAPAVLPVLVGTAQSTAQAVAQAPAQPQPQPQPEAEAEDEATEEAAEAQETPAAPAAGVEPVAEQAAEAQTSTEQGQTHMDESFTHADWVRETRRKAFEETKYDVQLRSYYLNRDKYDDTASEAWALGGSAGLKTGYFRERFAFGLTAYTSQPLYAPDDKDGTLLLAPGQEGYIVLGELYGEFLINEDTRLSVGRRGFDTPYINRNDSRMTPNTFESVLVLGQYGEEGVSQWRVGGGYVHSIKERTSEDFDSMAEDAGAPEGVERGVWMVGANYKAKNWSLGAVEYYSDDIINIFYTEAKYAIPFNDDMRLQFAAQYTDQQSVGDDLLRGEDFDAAQWGVKGEFGYGGALFTLAYTSTDDGTNMTNPWSGYPGYTSVQVEDFNRSGEDAWLVRAGYSFQSVKGMSVYGLYVDGSDPEDPGQFARKEYDLNLQWSVPEGIMKGLLLRLRYAHVEQDDPLGTKLDDLRVMVYYEPPSL